jgi:hypothetical protein
MKFALLKVLLPRQIWCSYRWTSRAPPRPPTCQHGTILDLCWCCFFYICEAYVRSCSQLLLDNIMLVLQRLCGQLVESGESTSSLSHTSASSSSSGGRPVVVALPAASTPPVPSVLLSDSTSSFSSLSSSGPAAPAVPVAGQVSRTDLVTAIGPLVCFLKKVHDMPDSHLSPSLSAFASHSSEPSQLCQRRWHGW